MRLRVLNREPVVDAARSFAEDYQQARCLFMGAARGANAELESLRHPERGPDGGELFTDVAWFGEPDAENVLVMISATHGVEGFCGSGAQVNWLERGEAARLPKGVAALLVHAINPYGFAWLRRTTHENIDLNRNWVDFDAPLPRNDGYEELRSVVLPHDGSEAAWAASSAAIADYSARHGRAALAQALSAGQYTHPQGIWYGGIGPSWSRRAQSSIFNSFLQRAKRVAILDYHTGLGPWGYAEPISTFPGDADEFRRARDWHGANVVSVPDGASSSAKIVGDGLVAACDLLRHAQVTPLALEYGTRPPDDVLAALRADAWLHAQGDPLSPAGQEIKRQIRAAFYGETDEWKGMVAGQSLQACRQAISGLLLD